jgi:cell shape-determining protein MreC
MTQLRLSIQRKQSAVAKYAALAVAVILLLFCFFLFGNQIKNSMAAVSSPLQQGVWGGGTHASAFLGAILQAGSLQQQNAVLQNQNQQLLAQLNSLQAITQANQAQTDISTTAQTRNFQLSAAGVIGLAGNDMLEINKGSSTGFKVGMPIITQHNVLLGTIVKVYPDFSQVQLVSSPQSVVQATVMQSAVSDTNDSASGVIRGTGSLGMMLDLVPTTAKLSANDILVTSALDKNVPSNLLIGMVTNVQKNDEKPFQQATIQPFFDLNQTDAVFAITNLQQ